MDPAHAQRSFDVRFEWGLWGAEAVASDIDVAVVVDVLSFTTTLTVALDSGITVLPYRWNDATSAGFAELHDAVLAVGRSAAGPGQISLSPATVRTSTASPSKLVLPSPNGSTIAHALADSSGTCVGAALRNADAVSSWIARQYKSQRARVAVIAAGERWPDGALRPSVEDLWGAGAVIAGLVSKGWTGLSPEAEMACAAYESAKSKLPETLYSIASGRELIDAGYRQDVAIAGELDGSQSVPLLVDRRFIEALES